MLKNLIVLIFLCFASNISFAGSCPILIQKIDQILSAKPEDRRTVFEEASGITKFKTDKKESLRKLDQTEANLIRLEDVIKEVKRQIISLQRQAGKAKRYKELKKEMKSLDLYLSSKQLNILKLKIEN